jgi:hypothetical protein
MCGVDGSCDQNADKGMQNDDLVRVGAHAYDHSYTQLYMQGRSKCNVSIETSQIDGKQGGDLVALITPVSGCTKASALAVMQMTDNLTAMCAAWNRYGNVSTDAGVSMTGTPHGQGLGPVQVWAAGTSFGGKANPPSTSPNYLLKALSSTVHGTGNGIKGSPVAFSTGRQRTVAEVSAIIASARSKELGTYAKYGELAAAKEMSQVSMTPCKIVTRRICMAYLTGGVYKTPSSVSSAPYRYGVSYREGRVKCSSKIGRHDVERALLTGNPWDICASQPWLGKAVGHL